MINEYGGNLPDAVGIPEEQLRAVAAEDTQISVAGGQPGILTDADVLRAGPGQADACLAAFAKAHIGGVDDSVEVHIGVGLHSGIVSVFTSIVLIV